MCACNRRNGKYAATDAQHFVADVASFIVLHVRMSPEIQPQCNVLKTGALLQS